MSVLIKDMDLPKHCISEDGLYTPCPMDRLWCMQMFAPEGLTMGQAFEDRLGKLPSWCPLAPVPTPHGRLGDIDAIATDIYSKEEQAFAEYNQNPDDEYFEGVKDGLHIAAKCLSFAPTIIEAEGEDE